MHSILADWPRRQTSSPAAWQLSHSVTAPPDRVLALLSCSPRLSQEAGSTGAASFSSLLKTFKKFLLLYFLGLKFTNLKQ